MPKDSEALADFIRSRISVHENGCWIWTGNRNRLGYGRMHISSRGEPRRQRMAHRVSYELAHGPVPETPRHEIHHVCGTPSCVNPDHLQCLSRSEHARLNEAFLRGTCVHGHPRSPENTYTIPSTGARYCRVCAAERARDKRHAAGLKGGPGAHNRVKTHCANGHPFDEENTRYIGRKRTCRICARDAHRRYRQRLRSL